MERVRMLDLCCEACARAEAALRSESEGARGAAEGAGAGQTEPCKCSAVQCSAVGHRDELIGRGDAGVWCVLADERQPGPCGGR
jgi:hypothetical protein